MQSRPQLIPAKISQRADSITSEEDTPHESALDGESVVRFVELSANAHFRIPREK
jgi:hypothetical protein